MHMAQLMPLTFTVSCFSKIQIDFTFLVLAHSGSPAQRAVKHVCVCACEHACEHACIWYDNDNLTNRNTVLCKWRWAWPTAQWWRLDLSWGYSSGGSYCNWTWAAAAAAAAGGWHNVTGKSDIWPGHVPQLLLLWGRRQRRSIAKARVAEGTSSEATSNITKIKSYKNNSTKININSAW